MVKGLIVYFDGPDGVGKTTQLELCREALEKEGRDVYVTHTLGGSSFGDKLRDVFFDDDERPAESDLYAALAIQHASAADMLRRRDNGEIILVDRSPLSMVAYQVYGDGLATKKGTKAAQEILELIKPDLLLLYMAPFKTLLARRQLQAAAGKKRDHFEKQDTDYHERTTQGYEAVAKTFSPTVIDATGSVGDIHHATMDAIDSVLSA